LFNVRVLYLLFLIGVVTVFCQAQDSHNQDSAKAPASTNSTAEKKPAASTNRIVMKVGGVPVTEADFEAMIGDIEPQPRDPDDPDAVSKSRRRMGEDYAAVMMLSQQALANHMDQSPEIRHQLAINRMQILSDAQFNSLLSQTKPSAEEINQYYSAHRSDFDRVKVRRLFIWKTGPGSANSKGLSPEAARARAESIVHGSDDAGKLAEELKDASEGLLDSEPVVFVRGALSPELEKIAFSLKPGEWAEGEETKDRLMLLQLVEHDQRPLAEVSSLIERRVQNRKLDARLDELKKKTGIWLDEQYFGAAVATASREQRPGSNPPSTNRKSAENTGDDQ
jgi:hypothetical protein